MRQHVYHLLLFDYSLPTLSRFAVTLSGTKQACTTYRFKLLFQGAQVLDGQAGQRHLSIFICT